MVSWLVQGEVSKVRASSKNVVDKDASADRPEHRLLDDPPTFAQQHPAGIPASEVDSPKEKQFVALDHR